MEKLLFKIGICAFLLVVCLVLYVATHVAKELSIGGIARSERNACITELVVLALCAVVAVAGVCLLLGVI